MDFTPKTLPTNLEAEQAVLAAVLMNNRALERVSEFLRPTHFSHPAHQEIYKLAERQFAAGIPFDIITAKNYLDQQGVLESVGGVDYLKQLSGAGATVVNVEQYGRIVYEHALRRDLIALGQEITDKAFIEDLDNPASRQIELAEQKLFDMATAGASEREVTPIAAALQTALNEAEIAYKADGQLSGLTTGLNALDKSISGLHHSDLIIIAGRPAMGKTTLAMNIAFNAANAIAYGRANQNYKGAVVFFSLEMSASQLAARVLSSQSKVPASAMREGNLTDEDFLKMSQYSAAIGKVPLFIDDTPGMSVPMMRTRARRLARKHGGIALIVIDYLQLVQGSGRASKQERVAEAYQKTLQYLKGNKIAGIFPGQLKQTATGSLSKMDAADIVNTELRDAAGESYEVIKTPDVNLALYANVEELKQGKMRILSIPSRNHKQFDPIELNCSLGSCSFYDVSATK